jgi:hypothetical protein
MTGPVFSRTPREIWRHLGSDYALSNTVIAAFVFLFGAKTVLTEINSLGGDPLQWLALGGGSLLVSVALCLLARRFLLPRCSASIRPWVVVAVYLLAGFTRGYLLTVVTTALDVPFYPGVAYTPMISSLLVMTLSAVTVGRFAEHRAQMNRLIQAEAQLIDMNENFEKWVGASNDELREQVRGFLDPAIIRIQELLDEKDSASPEALSNVLAATVSDVVRPLAQSLSKAPLSEVPAARQSTSAQAFRIISARVNIPRSIRPVVLIVVVLVFLAVQPVQMSVSASNPGTIPILILIGLTLAAIKWFWPPRFATFSILRASALLLAAYGVALVLPLVAVGLFLPSVVQTALPYFWVSLTYWLLLGLGTSIPSMFEQVSERDEKNTAASIVELEMAEARFRRQLWMNRRNLTWVLHGPIQSALVSSGLALSGTAVSDADRERVQVNLAAALNQLDSSSTAHPDLTTAIEGLAAVWSRSCTVLWRISPGAEALLENDRDAVVCIGEVVREGVSNAVRHGRAGWIDVDIDERQGLLRVSVQDNGTGLSSTADAGLGSAMFDEITHSWTRTAAAGMTTLVAWVPAAARPARAIPAR